MHTAIKGYFLSLHACMNAYNEMHAVHHAYIQLLSPEFMLITLGLSNLSKHSDP